MAAAVLVPTILAGLTLLWPRPQIEATLGDQARAALAAAGITGSAVTFSGRDATISGVPAVQRMQAIQAVEGVTGVRIATVPEPGSGGGAPPVPGPAPAAAAQPFGIARSGGDIVLTGVVGSDAEKAQLVAAAQASGRTVVDRITVTPNTAVAAGVTADGIGAVARALAAAGSDLTASITPDGVTLTGTVADDAARAAAVQAVGAALPGVKVDDQLTVAPANSGSAGTGDLDAAAKQALQTNLTALLQAAPISFGPDSPALTPQGSATVAKVLAAVKAAPGARLQIDGYVAAGPGNGQLTAQQLSDQRAAAVRDALVAGGVPADHLTAQGRGEGALGRRVQITVV